MIRSKAAVTTAELGDQYCMLGPYNEACVRLEVEVMEPSFSVLRESIEVLRSAGIKVGAWHQRIGRPFLSCLHVHVYMNLMYCT